MKEALLYKKLDSQDVLCYLCAHRCRVRDGKFGFCGVRQNIGGVFYTHTWGRVVASQIDPIEKKPLYHFLPGSDSFSIATIGCNFRCQFCQNWEISQASLGDSRERQRELLPQDIVRLATENNCRSISYTYSEPTIFFEYALETAKIARQEGLYNNFVTNGFMSEECLKLARLYLDAANVDLKFFRQESYQKICSGSLKPVLDSIRLMKHLGIWIEVTTLVVPGINDSAPELSDIAGFIASVSRDIPWHISRFHPDYKFKDYPVTQVEALEKAAQLGKKAGLNFVYLGNVTYGSDTYCPQCKKTVIKREVFDILDFNIQKGKCAFCGCKIPGFFG